MLNLFGFTWSQNNENQSLDLIECITKINLKIKEIKNRKAILEIKISNLLIEAFLLKKKNKIESALLKLRLKNLYTEENNKLDNILLMLENKKIEIEISCISKEVSKTLSYVQQEFKIQEKWIEIIGLS